VNPAALLTGSTRIHAKVIEEQCAYRTADPPFFVPNDKAQGSWTFAGRLNEDGTFKALDYKSLFSLGIGEGSAASWHLAREAGRAQRLSRYLSRKPARIRRRGQNRRRRSTRARQFSG
jgi:hypothetical protein